MTRRGFLVAGGIIVLSIAPADAFAGSAAEGGVAPNADVCSVDASSFDDSRNNQGHWSPVAAVNPSDAGVPSPPTRTLGTPVSADFVVAAIPGTATARGPPTASELPR